MLRYHISTPFLWLYTVLRDLMSHGITFVHRGHTSMQGKKGSSFGRDKKNNERREVISSLFQFSLGD